MQVVIVGASLAGVRTAQALRQRGFDGSVVLVGAESHLPYDRPPLSKDLLRGQKDPADITLVSAEDLADLDIRVELGATATGLDPDTSTVLVDGARMPFDHLVIATGATPRPLPFGRDLDGVHTLRTVEDSLALRQAMQAGARVVVIGAGFIGCEVASAALDYGLDVTMLELLPTPLYQSLGPEVGALAADLHRSAGVDLRCGIGARELIGRGGAIGAVTGAVLSDGTRIDADAVVVGIGVVPETAWLEGSGLELADGVICDERLRASGHPHIHAVGDVARWHHPVLGRAVRVEHWTHATESASFAAADILDAHTPGSSSSYDPVTYVWSDQLGRRIQILGLPGAGDHFEIVHGAHPGRLVGLYQAGGFLTAAVGIDFPGRLMRYRPLLGRRTPWDEALTLAGELEG